MVKLSQDQFLSKLSKFYTSKKQKGSVYVEMKRSLVLEGKDKYKHSRKQKKLRYLTLRKQIESNVDQPYPVIFKTKCEKKAGSTIAQDQEIYKFAHQLINVFRLNMNIEKQIVTKKKIKKLSTQKNVASKRTIKRIAQNKRNKERRSKRTVIKKEQKRIRQRAAVGKVQQQPQQQLQEEPQEQQN